MASDNFTELLQIIFLFGVGILFLILGFYTMKGKGENASSTEILQNHKKFFEINEDKHSEEESKISVTKTDVDKKIEESKNDNKEKQKFLSERHVLPSFILPFSYRRSTESSFQNVDIKSQVLENTENVQNDDFLKNIDSDMIDDSGIPLIRAISQEARSGYDAEKKKLERDEEEKKNIVLKRLKGELKEFNDMIDVQKEQQSEELKKTFEKKNNVVISSKSFKVDTNKEPPKKNSLTSD